MKRQVTLPVFVALALAVLLLGLALALPSAHPAAAQPAASPLAAQTAWSSGWVTIDQGEMLTLTHNLGGDPDDYAVELWFLDTDNNIGMNRRDYGGVEANGLWFGAHWEQLTATTINVYRQPNDNAADMVRVLVYIPDEPPDYDSGWTTINVAETLTFTHGLGAPASDLVVSLWFRGGTRGTHQYAYGGLIQDAPPFFFGAYWHNLLENTVSVTRLSHDIDAEEVRVTVSHSDPPDYDSNWTAVTPGVNTFNHDLNWPAGLIVVRADCSDPTPGGWGVHQRYAGGNEAGDQLEGANVQNMTNTSVEFVRWPDDTSCPNARLRMWIRSYDTYLPLVLNSPSSFQQLSYDDGGAESFQSNAEGSGFAVHFNTAGPAQLMEARLYLDAATGANAIAIHVWDAAHNDLVTPFNVTPPMGEAWFTVDLSSLNLTVDGDFYVGYLYHPAMDYDPSIGVDTSAPDGHSYEVPWMVMSGLDYMIRVTLSP